MMVKPEAETFPVETAKQIAMTCSDILGEALLTSNCVPWSMSQILSWSHQNCVRAQYSGPNDKQAHYES